MKDENRMLSLREMKTGDFVRYSRCVGLKGLEVMSARWVEHSFAPHMHDFYAVSLNYGGRGAFDCRSELRDAVPGTCSLIAPGEVHTGHATSGEGWIYRNLYIETSLMAALLKSLDWQGPLDVEFIFPLVRDTILAARLAHVFASLTESNSLLQNESLLLSVVARLITDHFVSGRALSDAGREHAAVRRVKDWLDANLIGLLREHNVALALTDTSFMPRPWELKQKFDLVTADFAYVRWLGDRKGIEKQTTTWDKTVIDRTSDLKNWVEVFKSLVSNTKVLKIFAFSNNHYAGHGPATAKLFINLWNKKP